MKRVVKPGGFIVIGVPGYVRLPFEKYIHFLFEIFPFVRKFAVRYANFLVRATLSLKIHNAPGDYYRFSEQAVKEVFFEGMKVVEICSIMICPRIIGVAIKEGK